MVESVSVEAIKNLLASHYGSLENVPGNPIGDKLLALIGLTKTQAAKDADLIAALGTDVQHEDYEGRHTMTVCVNDMAALLDDLRRQRDRADALQERMTEMLEATIGRRVRRFHHRFGHPIAHTPCVPDDAQVRFRLSLIVEEVFELIEAAIDASPEARNEWAGTYARGLTLAHEHVKALITNAPLTVDLPEFADALGDIAYVVEGTNAVFGIDGTAVLAEIQRANMSKDPVYVLAKDDHHRAPDPTQKPTKPESWRGPDIAGVLIAQGWRPEA